MACYIQGRVVSLYGVDIHPNVPVGKGIFMDHAVGIVIGETAVIEDDVTLFQSVTLGGEGKFTVRAATTIDEATDLAPFDFIAVAAMWRQFVDAAHDQLPLLTMRLDARAE